MDVRYLQTFLFVARLLSFTEAAKTLNYSQSTISEQIHNIEEYLGTKLFERLGKKVYLTEPGKKLLPYAERMVNDLGIIKSLFHDSDKVTGFITIGAAETLCAFWLPPLLKQYRSLYPEVQINIKVGNCIDFPEWLQSNSIDVAFGFNDESKRIHLRQLELFRGETVFIASNDCPLSLVKKMETKNLEGYTLLLPEGYCGYPMDLKNMLEKEQVKANMILEFGSLEAIKQCVKNDLGVSLLPKMVVEDELKRGELVRLDWCGAPIFVQAQMVLSREKWLSPALIALEELIRGTVECKKEI